MTAARRPRRGFEARGPLRRCPTAGSLSLSREGSGASFLRAASTPSRAGYTAASAATVGRPRPRGSTTGWRTTSDSVALRCCPGVPCCSPTPVTTASGVAGRGGKPQLLAVAEGRYLSRLTLTGHVGRRERRPRTTSPSGVDLDHSPRETSTVPRDPLLLPCKGTTARERLAPLRGRAWDCWLSSTAGVHRRCADAAPPREKRNVSGSPTGGTGAEAYSLRSFVVREPPCFAQARLCLVGARASRDSWA